MRNILIIVLAALALTIFATAIEVLPPPVKQSIGVYDTSVNQFTESLCRECHNSTYLGGVPTRHHGLIASGEYGCMDCHPVTSGPNGQYVLIDRNCIACHSGSAFYANPSLTPGRPHHNTTFAQQRNCKFCHGGFVDNYDSPHYIPTYNESIVTPSTSSKVYNSSSGRHWGGCLACHQQALSTSPNIMGPVARTTGPGILNDNNNTHHLELIGVTQGLDCAWCHRGTNYLSIRVCEDCHSVATLHNIQYNYTATNGKAGFGHIGANWDCNGCHAFWDAGSVPPFGGPIVIDVSSVTPSVLTAGQATVVTLTGDNFVQANYMTTVKVDGNGITPMSVTNSQIVVTVPALTAGVHQIQAVKDGVSDSTTSKLSALTVVSPVTISSAKLESGTITITGTGFGQNAKYVTIAKAGGNVVYSDSITNWGDAQIVATSSVAAVGDTITVTTPTGSATATITAGTQPPADPTIASAKLVVPKKSTTGTLTILGTALGNSGVKEDVYVDITAGKKGKTTRYYANSIASWAPGKIVADVNKDWEGQTVNVNVGGKIVTATIT